MGTEGVTGRPTFLFKTFPSSSTMLSVFPSPEGSYKIKGSGAAKGGGAARGGGSGGGDDGGGGIVASVGALGAVDKFSSVPNFVVGLPSLEVVLSCASAL